MFSGKTDELLRRLREADSSGSRAIAVKPSTDDRDGGSEVVSHTGQRRPAVVVESATVIPQFAIGADVLGVDEAQFFDETLIDVVADCRASGTRIIVAGLDRDFRAAPFGAVLAIAEEADQVDALHAVCGVCGRPATLTQRLVGGCPAPRDSATIVVGGPELYQPRCVACHAADAEPRRGSESPGTVENKADAVGFVDSPGNSVWTSGNRG